MAQAMTLDQLPAVQPYLRALVVDDVELNRKIIRGILERQGILVEEAACSAMAMQAVAGNAFDVILLDVELDEGGSGYDILEMIRSRPEFDTTPVILVTGTARDGNSVARGLLAGAQDYVTKPFNPVVLAARVAAVCRMRTAVLTMQQRARRTLEKASVFATEIASAGAVQCAALPVVPFRAPSIRASAEVVPASSVSGDAFDIVEDRLGRVSLVLIDAAGHGSASGLILSAARTAVRQAIARGESMETVVKAMHETFKAQGGVLEASAALGVLRFSADRENVEILNASLPAIVALGSQGEFACYRSQSAPVDARRLEHRYELARVSNGSVWMMCSDGATAGSFEDGDVLALARRLGLPRSGSRIAQADASSLRLVMLENITCRDMWPIDDATLVIATIAREEVE